MYSIRQLFCHFNPNFHFTRKEKPNNIKAHATYFFVVPEYLDEPVVEDWFTALVGGIGLVVAGKAD